jgi:hypothetical protein
MVKNILYHTLSLERLEQKRAYSVAHGGRLQITGHVPQMDATEGAVGAYLHVLPSLAGSIRFAGIGQARAIRITLKPEARHVSFRGPVGRYDPAQYPGAQVARWIWDMPGLVFQEWALLDEDAVESWTDDQELIRSELHRDLEQLRRGELELGEVGFYPEIDLRAQIGQAELVARHLGLREPDEGDTAREQRLEQAYLRLGAGYSQPLSTLVFLDLEVYPFLERLSHSEGPARSIGWEDASGIWARHDELVSEAIRKLQARLAVEGTPAGPLVLEYTQPRHPARPKDALQLRVGVPLREEGGEACPAPLPEKLVHRGRWLDLEETLGSALAREPALVRQHLLTFRGARSPDSHVEIELDTV